MPYDITINLVEILRTTLYLLEHTEYTGKASKTVEDLRKCLLGTIAELESVSGTTAEQQMGAE